MSISLYGGIFVPLMTRAMQNSGDLHPDLVDDTNKQNETALLAMTLLGAGEIIGGYLIGTVRDKASNKAAYISQMLL